MQRFADQLTFSISNNELYRGWCGLQNAYPSHFMNGEQPFGSYYCSPGGWDEFESTGIGGPCLLHHGTTIVTLSAAQCTLCSAVGMMFGNCACDSCHCTAWTTSTDKISLTFSGDTATGQIEHNFDGQVDNNPASLHFTRLKP